MVSTLSERRGLTAEHSRQWMQHVGLHAPLDGVEAQVVRDVQHELDDVAAQADGDVTAALLVEGAALHLEADLKWLEICQQRLIRESNGGTRARG